MTSTISSPYVQSVFVAQLSFVHAVLLTVVAMQFILYMRPSLETRPYYTHED